MEKKTLSDHAVLIWRIHITALMVCAAFLCGAVFVFSTVLAICAGIVFFLIYLFFMLFYAPMLYRKCFFILQKDALTIEKGVFLHKRMKLPVNKIQYTEFVQTPVQRVLKTYSAVFHTAGSMVVLNQLSEKSVMQIKRLTGDHSVTGGKHV